MNIARDDTSEEENNILPFQPVPKPAGKGPKDPTDWLSSLPWQTQFLVRPVGYTGSDLAEFQLGGAHECGAVLLFGEDNRPPRWYDPKMFCKNFELFAIIRQPLGNTEDTEGEPDG